MDARQVVLQHITDNCSMLTNLNGSEIVNRPVILSKLVNDIAAYCLMCGMQYEKLSAADVSAILQGRTFDTKGKMLLEDQYVKEGLQSLGIQIDLSAIAAELFKDIDNNTVASLLDKVAGNKDFMNQPQQYNASEMYGDFITGMTSSTSMDTDRGKDRCMNIFVRVFMNTSHRFRGMTFEEAQQEVQKILQNKEPEIFTLAPTGGMQSWIADYDAVTICEALYWTAIYITKGINQDVVLGYAHVKEDKDDMTDYEINRPKIWNCILIAPFDGDAYTNYGSIGGAKASYIPILAKSLDTYSVGVRSTKEM